MKKTELTKSIKEEIFEILAEADQEDIDAQSDLNKELETTKGHKDDLGDALSESLNPEVLRDVNRYIARTAKRYDYSEQDAVYAIMAALKQRDFDDLNEATRQDLGMSSSVSKSRAKAELKKDERIY